MHITWPFFSALRLALLALVLSLPALGHADIVSPGYKKINVGWAVANPQDAKGFQPVVPASINMAAGELLEKLYNPNDEDDEHGPVPEMRVVKAGEAFFSGGFPICLLYQKPDGKMAETVLSICTSSYEVLQNSNLKHILIVYSLDKTKSPSAVNPTEYKVGYSDGSEIAVPYNAKMNFEQVIAEANKIKSEKNQPVNKNTLWFFGDVSDFGAGGGGTMLLLFSVSALSIMALIWRLAQRRQLVVKA